MPDGSHKWPFYNLIDMGLKGLPLRSDATVDKLYVRKITNIATGQAVDNKYFDESLRYVNEGYAQRYAVPEQVIKIGAKMPPFLVRAVKKLLRK